MVLLRFLLLLVFFSVPLVSASSSSYFYAGSSLLATKDSDSGLEYVYSDRLGSDISSSSLPFGQVVTEGGRFAFTGKERDSSALHYFGARYYDSDMGRFTSIDPVELSFSYQYVHNNPLVFVDSTGGAVQVKDFTSPQTVVATELVLQAAWAASKPGLVAAGSGIATISMGVVAAIAVLLIPATANAPEMNVVITIDDFSWVDRVDPAFGHLPFESLLRSNEVDAILFDYWMGRWSGHSSRVTRVTNSILGELGLPLLPDSYIHDSDKASYWFMDLDYQIDLIGKDGPYSKKEPYIDQIHAIHSDNSLHHLGDNSGLWGLSSIMRHAVVVEFIVDWLDAAVHRTPMSLSKALGAFRANKDCYDRACDASSREFVDNLVDHVIPEHWSAGSSQQELQGEG